MEILLLFETTTDHREESGSGQDVRVHVDGNIPEFCVVFEPRERREKVKKFGERDPIQISNSVHGDWDGAAETRAIDGA